MLSLTKNNHRLTRTYNRYFDNSSKKDNLKIMETESGFHYEMEIPGYVKEDFNFYISHDNLVVTTGRSKVNQIIDGDSRIHKHSYCYPSAYFKMNIPLPTKFIKNEILVNYKNEILSFDLLKSQAPSKEGLHA